MLPSKLLLCKSCMSANKVVASLCTNKIYRHLHEVKCLKCKTKWLVCAVHDKRFTPRRFYLAKRHLREVDHSFVEMNSPHKRANYQCLSERNSIDNNDVIIASDCNEEDLNDNLRIVSDSRSTSGIDETIEIFKSGHKNVSYDDYNQLLQRYIQCESISKGNGIKLIVSCAFAMNLTSDYSLLSYKEAVYHLKATLFCHSLTSSQISQFTDLSHMMGTIFYSSLRENDTPIKSHPPNSQKDIQRYYLKTNTSIANNIPIPTIHENHDHAYVTIKEALQHFLCFETNIDGMLIKPTSDSYKRIISHSSSIPQENISMIIRSKVKNSLRSSDISPLIIYIILWSDDFEPNNVKQHKKSTWIKTVTFAPPKHCQTSSKHTYVIALSAKNTNHELINHYFTQELKELKMPTYMYSKATNCNIPIVVETLAVSADRPERSSLNFMLGHNGITSRRWRYSAYIKPNITKSCVICAKKRIIFLCNLDNCEGNGDTLCSSCCDWDFNHSKMGVEKPNDYPTQEHPDSPEPPLGREVQGKDLLYPIELSYETLKSGVQFCFFNCYHGVWSKTASLTYLKSLCINEKYGNEYVYEIAMNCKNNSNINSSDINDFIVYPVIWQSGISLDQCIDTPMHHLFHGVIKSIMEETMHWLSKKVHSQYKEFGDFVNDALLRIQETQVDWCRMEQFTSGRNYSIVGWQAEQYLAFSRCIIIIYSSVRDIVGDNEVGIDEFECMIQSLLCVFSRIMNDEDVDSDELMDYVKCFLSSCDLFENTAFMMDGTDPFWYKKSNFLSLLNLPMQIKKFGSIKNYWEGSRERSIQQIKPFLIKMRSSASFYRAKMKHMYISQTLKHLNEDELFTSVSDEFCEGRDSIYNRYLSFKVYSDCLDFLNISESLKVLSVVLLKNQFGSIDHFICQRIKGKNKIQLHLITFDDTDGFNKMGLWYAPLSVNIKKDTQEYSPKEIHETAYDFGLVCQCLSKFPLLRKCYTVVTQSWKYRNEDGDHCLPLLSKDFFLNTYNK